MIDYVREQIMPHGVAVNREYRFDLDPIIMDQISGIIQDMLNREVLQADNGQPIILQQTVTAYEAATAAAVTNIITQTQAIRRDAEQTLMSAPYQNRIQYLASRIFEEMEGFTDATRTELSRVLYDAIARGDGLDAIGKQITQRLSVSESRALRIARTEINNSHRRAIWDEDQQANDDGILTRLLWMSALSPTSRAWHCSRHGHIYSKEQVEDFYSQGGNSVNCKCTQVSILVDANGRPLSDRLPEKLKARGKAFVEQHFH